MLEYLPKVRHRKAALAVGSLTVRPTLNNVGLVMQKALMSTFFSTVGLVNARYQMLHAIEKIVERIGCLVVVDREKGVARSKQPGHRQVCASRDTSK